MKNLFLLMLIPMIAFGQLQFIPINADYTSFVLNDTMAYVEIYIGYFQGNLKYIPNPEGGMTASFTNKIELSRDGKMVDEQSHNYQNSTQDTSKLSGYNQFIDIFRLQVPYGKYQAKVQLSDHNSNLTGEYTLDLTTITPQSGMFFSDIELSAEIKQDTAKGLFYKNGLKVLPNPSSTFDVLHPMMYFYTELNNLNFNTDKKNHYSFEYFITSLEGDTLKKKNAVSKEIRALSQIEIGGLNVMALAQNTYILNLKAVDLESGKTAEAKRRFGVFKPSAKRDSIVAETAKNKVMDLFLTMKKEELLEEFQMAKYLASRTEEKVFKNLENEDAMRQFLTQFWTERDALAHVPPGMSRHRYMRLVEYANLNFSTMGRKGWKSDRGRILMIYNEPDELERFPSSMDQVPYQIWRYHNLEGGAFFVFADLDGFGDYQLLHSSYRKELQNPNWENIINKQVNLLPGGQQAID